MARSHKTNKSVLKRIKVTARKKILKRHPHQNHFNAKESGNRTRLKRGTSLVTAELDKKIKALVQGA